MRRQSKPDAGRPVDPTGSGKVVQFRRRLPERRSPEQPITHPLSYFDEQEDQRRMQQNIAAAVVVLLLVVSGFWLIDHLRTSARIAVCIEAGHRNCVPLDPDWRAPQ
jgi:hypothetical protein